MLQIKDVYHILKPLPEPGEAIWEDVRRLGIILTAAGLLSEVLEEGNVFTAGGLVLAGLVLLLFGNLEHP